MGFLWCYFCVTLNNWGYVIKRLREQMGLTQEELAAKVGISRSLQARIELGHVEQFSQDRLNRYAVALEITPSQLSQEIYGVPPSKPETSELSTRKMEMVDIPQRGTIPCGYPSESIESFGEFISVPKDILTGASSKVYALRVSGESLMGDGIHHGQSVIVEPDYGQINDGKIYAIRMNNGEVVARHVSGIDGKLRLTSSNDGYKDMEPKEIEILGRIIAKGSWSRL